MDLSTGTSGRITDVGGRTMLKAIRWALVGTYVACCAAAVVMSESPAAKSPLPSAVHAAPAVSEPPQRPKEGLRKEAEPEDGRHSQVASTPASVAGGVVRSHGR